MLYQKRSNINLICTSQAEECEVSAELEFLNQQNLILNMENKALKQRLESLAQEQVIKYRKLISLTIKILLSSFLSVLIYHLAT